MLKAIAERLKQLMADKNDNFHNQIRRRVGKRATPLLEKRLRNLVCLMPELLSRALTTCEKKEIPSEIKRSIGFVLAYFYQAKDFLPEEEEGLFGYLDDAYCVALVYEKILRFLQKSGMPINPMDANLMKQFPLIKRSVKVVIPVEAQKISDMLTGVYKGDNESFYAVFK